MKSYSLSIPGDPVAVQLLIALKGAPLSCLAALRIAHPRPLGRRELSAMTGWAKDKITAAMTLLVEVYAFAARIGRYESWCLTTKGVQLRLPLFSEISDPSNLRALPEDENIALPSSSSSSLLHGDFSFSLETPTTPPIVEGEKIVLEPLPEQLSDLFDGILLGCPQTFAESAMRAALKEWKIAQVECELTLWVLYVESPLGRTIDLPPARFAAAKIKKLEKAPDFFHRSNRNDSRYGTAWDRWETENRDRIKRAKTLLKEVYDYSSST